MKPGPLLQATLQRLRRPPHPWWHHLPPERRQPHQRLQLQVRRLSSWLRQRRQLILLTLLIYLVGCGLAALLGLPQLALLAALPLLLVPPVGWLVYWLVWREFHR